MRKMALLFSLLGAQLAQAEEPKWELVWSDEFDYQGLPDSTKWDCEEGFVRNKEVQYYTRARVENARVEEGMLVIEARKELYTGKEGKTANYTSASLRTKGKAEWTYGRIEVRAKLPRGNGAWPAIWTLGANVSDVRWPKCGEIDIIEFYGRTPQTVSSAVHFFKDERKQRLRGHSNITNPSEGFHVYAIEWSFDRIDFLLDGKKYLSVPLDKAGEGEANAFRMPHFLVLNYALGGVGGGPVDDAVLPQKYLVDYVRVYQLH